MPPRKKAEAPPAPQSELIGRDVYYRHNKGPVQHARVWDAERFIANQQERGRSSEKPKERYTVSLATPLEYLREHRK